MKKEKIHLEYLLNATSKNILWSAISTPTGLEDWFADKVVSNDKIVEFHWGKTEQRDAEIIAIRAYSFIRFRWLDDENERDYFEIKMNYNDSAQKTPAVRKNVRGMNAPITNNATIIPTGFSSGIVGFSWPDVLQNAVIRCIALLFQEKHFR